MSDEQLLLEQDYIRDASMKIRELVSQLGAQIGENVRIGRFERFELGQ